MHEIGRLHLVIPKTPYGFRLHYWSVEHRMQASGSLVELTWLNAFQIFLKKLVLPEFY